MPGSRRHSHFGFTLIELMVVILLMAMLASVAMPRLLPLITLTEHQNEARHLVSYGRAAMAHAALAHENIVVRIDLDMQEYWVESQPDVYEEPEKIDDDPYGEDDEWIPEDPYELQQASQTILMGEDAEQEYQNEEDQNKILDRQKEMMQKDFASMARNSLFARARRIHHDEDELYGDDSRFRVDEEEEMDFYGEGGPNLASSALLSKHRVIETVFIESVSLGEDAYTGGIVDIELSPLGLSTNVSMVLINEENDVMIVHWDPLTGNAWFVDAGEAL
ncbi:MAG TPA: type II secretion system protein [Candidatus Hydrogenedentes bacterium]|nr:type II secretion system protein [Candidatus Hydrogenedentota bacterium]